MKKKIRKMQKKQLTKFNNKLEIKRNFLNLLKSMYQKPIAIIIISEKSFIFRNKSRMTLFLFLVDIILEVLAKSESKSIELKRVTIN